MYAPPQDVWVIGPRKGVEAGMSCEGRALYVAEWCMRCVVWDRVDGLCWCVV